MRLAIILMVFLFGCMTEKNLPKHNDKYPEAAAKYAAAKFPADTATIVDTLFKEGETKWLRQLVRDTIIRCDSVEQETKAPIKRVPLQCPPSSERVDTFYIRTTATVTNGAPLAACALERDRHKLEAEKWRPLAKNRFWIIVALTATNLLMIVLYVKKK